LEAERSANETARVLYVAATRSICCLHLVAAVKLGSKGEVKAPAGTLLELLWKNVGGDFQQAAAQVEAIEAVPQAEVVPFVPQLMRLAVPVVPEIFSRRAATKNMLNEFVEAGDLTVNRLAADIGILAHRYMEIIAREGSDAWPDARMETLMPFMMRWLVRQGHSEQQAEQGARQVNAALQLTLRSEQGRWLLQGREDSAYELAIMHADAQLISTHVVDRTFVENGERWIIDYKSAFLAADITDAALQHEAERYWPQLERYAALFEAEGLPVRKGVFFLMLGRLVELP
jgi:ATP-dependent helicase/nuclease subunit A